MDLNIAADKYVKEGKFEIYKAQSEQDEAKYIVQKINELVSLQTHPDIEGNIEYSKISILGRNRFVFKYIEEQLQENQIPFYFKSGNIGVKFETIFMKLFDNYFRIVINPSDKIHARKLKSLLKVENFEDANQIQTSRYS